MSICVDLPSMLGIGADEAKKLTIGVAISGGRDSVALLHILFEQGYRLVAINVEHGIRGEESVQDSLFVKKFCEQLGVPLIAFEVDAPAFAKANGYTLEQGARTLRYMAFDKALAEGRCDYIALAHHREDQVETVLMRILRGTGVKGIAGMSPVNGRYIRPLLSVPRDEIDRYVEEHGLAFREDASNGDIHYTRNFLRQELNVLRTRFPALGDAVLRLTASAREAEEYIDSQVPDIDMKDGEAYVKIDDLKEPAIAKRLVLKAASALGVRQDIEQRHFPLIFALKDAENGKMIQLTHSLDAHKQNDRLVFALRREKANEDETEFEEGIFAEFGISVQKLPVSAFYAAQRGDGALFADADSVPHGAVIRRRREGDCIEKFGGGSKSLGDFLTDKKVPKRKRDSLAVIACGNNILAVAGVDICAACKVTTSTRYVYKIETL